MPEHAPPTSRARIARGGVRAVIWDMDGTLIDSGVILPEAYIQTILALGGPAYQPHEIIAAYALGPPGVMISRLLGRESMRSDLERYYEHLSARAARVVAYPGIVDPLDALATTTPTAVFTGASHKAAQILLGSAGLLRYFDVVVGGDQVARAKPEPDGVLFACNGLDVPVHEAAYVGDSPRDLEAARRSGALPVAAPWGELYDPAAPAAVTLRHPLEVLSLTAPA